MKNIWRKYKTGIISIGYCVVAACLFYFIFSPYKNKVESQADKIQETALENQIFEKKTSKLSQMKTKYNDYQNNKDKMGKFLKDGEEVNLIKRLEALGEETQNKVVLNILEKNEKISKDAVASSPKSAAKEGNILKDAPSQNFLSLEINLEGSYQNLIDFLKKMESMNYYADVISLDLTKTIAGDASGSGSAANVFSPEQDFSSPQVEKETLKSKVSVIVFKN